MPVLYLSSMVDWGGRYVGGEGEARMSEWIRQHSDASQNVSFSTERNLRGCVGGVGVICGFADEVKGDGADREA